MPLCTYVFFFNDTATTEIYTLSLHDALPIYPEEPRPFAVHRQGLALTRPTVSFRRGLASLGGRRLQPDRSEEHTSELQSHLNLVCRLLLEKKNNRLIHQWRYECERY